jgi:hypothetical protein
MAYQDVQDVIDGYGNDITILTDSESQVTRDDYNSITQREPNRYSIRVFPVRLNPSDKDLQKVGIREKVDLILYISNKQMGELNQAIGDIDVIRHTIEWKSQTYKITHKNPYSQFNGVDLWTVLGCMRQ